MFVTDAGSSFLNPSRIRFLIFYPSRMPDPGVKKAPDPGSVTLLIGPKSRLSPLPNIRFGMARGVEAIGTDEAAPLLVHHFQHPPGI
jgi:hypothetical protein